jgi:predicted sulfurtransferase
MKTAQRTTISMALALALVMLAWMSAASAAEVPRMTKEELKSMLTDDNVLILDVRAGRDWSGSEFKIQGAVRVDPEKVDTWADNHPKDKKVVLYCA